MSLFSPVCPRGRYWVPVCFYFTSMTFPLALTLPSVFLQMTPLHIPDSMTMLGQRWPMVVRARWPNIIKKALAQCNFAHRPYVRPTCWFYVGPSCWPNNRPTCRSYVGPTFAHGCTCTLAQHHKKCVGPM